MTWSAAVFFLTCAAFCFDKTKGHLTGNVNYMSVSEMVQHSVNVAVAELEKKKVIEKRLFEKGTDSKYSSGSYLWHHSKFMKMSDPSKVQLLDEKAYIVLRAAREFEKLSGYSIQKLKKDHDLVQLWRKVIAPHCNCPKPQCNQKAHYRTPDGTCNNFHSPYWGASNRPQKRYLPAVYLDGLNKPRSRSVTGSNLPSTRHISNLLHNSDQCMHKNSDHLTLLFMSWGQFFDHDVVNTPQTKGFNNSDIRCCGREYKRNLRGACFPIAIPPNDRHFTQRCMNFVRSSAAPNDYCEPDWRNPINQQTSYIDASMVYGANEKDFHNLRTHYGGFLKMMEGGLLPIAKDSDCIKELKNDYCFAAGDGRSMVVPSLAYLHTLFVREHNRLAAGLGMINPHWSDEIIYQETRKIIAALIQHITYKEYLPLVLNKHFLVKHGLTCRSKDYNTVYNPKIDATSANVFNVAAFRFGHSQITDEMDLTGLFGKKYVKLPIERTFNRPALILYGKGSGYDGMGRTLLNDPQNRDDRFMADGVRNKLFEDENDMKFDLAALNIQRGRDHGIPSYNAWRLWCGFSPVVHFGIGPGGMKDHEPNVIMKFAKLYSHPDDIDLFSAGLSERRVPGGRTGPTFACIIAKQFEKLKFGDRFWYENKFKAIGFTRNQLREIKKISMSSLMCVSTKIKQIQRHAFRITSNSNPRIPCEFLPQLDLRFWKEDGRSRSRSKYELGSFSNSIRSPYSPVPFWNLSSYGSNNSWQNIYRVMKTY